MIGSFACTETERIFRGFRSPAFPPEIQNRALEKLRRLDAARSLGDLALVRGDRLEKLHGDRAGQWSIRINDQWRICFTWEAGPENVEIVDYH